MTDMLESIVDAVGVASLLALVILVATAAEIWVGYWHSGALQLQPSPLVRRFGWRPGLLALALALVPYWNPLIGAVLASASLLNAAYSLERVWLVRSLGAADYAALLLKAARTSSLRRALLPLLAGSTATLLVGVALVAFEPNPREWSFWFAIGIALYAVGNGIHRSLFMARLFRLASSTNAA